MLIVFNSAHYQRVDLSQWIAGNSRDVLAPNFAADASTFDKVPRRSGRVEAGCGRCQRFHTGSLPCSPRKWRWVAGSSWRLFLGAELHNSRVPHCLDMYHCVCRGPCAFVTGFRPVRRLASSSWPMPYSDFALLNSDAQERGLAAIAGQQVQQGVRSDLLDATNSLWLAIPLQRMPLTSSKMSDEP